MKTKLICGLALLGAVATATAQPVTYTGTGVMTGSLNGTNFTETPFTITTTGDLGNIVSSDIGAELGYGTSVPSYTLVGTTTIQIDGFGLATFNGGDLFGVWAADYEFAAPQTPYEYISFHDFGSTVDPVNYGTDITGFNNTTDFSYDLSTATTLSGQIGADGELYSTDLGDLLITTVGSGANPNMNFTASITPAPEPSTFALAGIGGISALAMFRRRK